MYVFLLNYWICHCTICLSVWNLNCLFVTYVSGEYKLHYMSVYCKKKMLKNEYHSIMRKYTLQLRQKFNNTYQGILALSFIFEKKMWKFITYVAWRKKTDISFVKNIIWIRHMKFSIIIIIHQWDKKKLALLRVIRASKRKWYAHYNLHYTYI